MWQSFSPYTKLIIEIAIFLLLALIIRFLKSKLKNNVFEDKYKKRISVMTPTEQKFFRRLQQEYGEKYYIFPQINLDKLLEPEGNQNNYRARNRIAQKSVDFVLADKETLSTQLVIELDDWTHKLDKRKERDEFVEKLLLQSNTKMQRFELNKL